MVLTGRHAGWWKLESGVVIREPGMRLKAYRSISLPTCMGNVVEKLVAQLLDQVAERRGLLRDGQYGSRIWRLVINVAAIMID